MDRYIYTHACHKNTCEFLIFMKDTDGFYVVPCDRLKFSNKHKIVFFPWVSPQKMWSSAMGFHVKNKIKQRYMDVF